MSPGMVLVIELMVKVLPLRYLTGDDFGNESCLVSFFLWENFMLIKEVCLSDKLRKPTGRFAKGSDSSSTSSL